MTPYPYLLFPGRHQLLTRFQARYLRSALAGQARELGGERISFAADASVVFAVTSADHSNTRRNPISGHRREAQIERFSTSEEISSLTYLLDDVPQTKRFAAYMLGAITTADGPKLSPENTVVACSTPAVYKLFTDLGFRVLGVELGAAGEQLAERPWDLIERIVAGAELADLDQLIHPASAEILGRYGLVSQIRRLHADPILSGEGELTETRDYRTYSQDFDSGAARKWEQLRAHVRGGRIVDVGCGVGSLLAEIAADPGFAESDLYGIEVARPLYEECEHRRRQGAFANPNTFFHQRNLLAGPIFDPGSINTTLTVALTHELYSYIGVADLRQAMRMIRAQTATGGAWVNLDVCGPENGAERVWLELESPPPARGFEFLELTELAPEKAREQLRALNLAELLLQFAHDWRRAEGDPRSELSLINFDGRAVVEIELRVAMEFLAKKDYLDNWLSEMHERFCFWDWPQWQHEIEAAGFELVPGSGALSNQWLIANRFAPAARLHPVDELDVELPWPATHLLAVAQPR